MTATVVFWIFILSPPTYKPGFSWLRIGTSDGIL